MTPSETSPPRPVLPGGGSDGGDGTALPSGLDSVAAETAGNAAGQASGWRWIALAVLLGGALAAAAGVAAVAFRGGGYHRLPLTGAAGPGDPNVAAGDTRGAEAGLRRRLERLRPGGVYIVVDTYHNRLRVYRDGHLLREAVCSTGGGSALRDPRTGRLWLFDTPLGERRVQRKIRNPVWTKPDWAFIEDGYLPPRDIAARIDPASLGDFALDLGEGYLIHGTLFQTLLGRRITHGCIRLGDEDLAYVYRNVPLGARVVLY